MPLAFRKELAKQFLSRLGRFIQEAEVKDTFDWGWARSVSWPTACARAAAIASKGTAVMVFRIMRRLRRYSALC
jgi:hypothetical protein